MEELKGNKGKMPSRVDKLNQRLGLSLKLSGFWRNWRMRKH
jgi:hypothetical protein